MQPSETVWRAAVNAASVESPEAGREKCRVWAAEPAALWGAGAVGVRAEEAHLLSSSCIHRYVRQRLLEVTKQKKTGFANPSIPFPPPAEAKLKMLAVLL